MKLQKIIPFWKNKINPITGFKSSSVNERVRKSRENKLLKKSY